MSDAVQYVQSLTVGGCFSHSSAESVTFPFFHAKKCLKRPTSMICDITDGFKVNAGPIFIMNKFDAES